MTHRPNDGEPAGDTAKSEDRTSEPPGYTVEEHDDDFDPPFWRARVTWEHATCWLDGREAIAACWAHYDAIAKPAYDRGFAAAHGRYAWSWRRLDSAADALCEGEFSEDHPNALEAHNERMRAGVWAAAVAALERMRDQAPPGERREAYHFAAAQLEAGDDEDDALERRDERMREETLAACIAIVERKHDELMNKAGHPGYDRQIMEERAIAVAQLIDEIRYEAPGADALANRDERMREEGRLAGRRDMLDLLGLRDDESVMEQLAKREAAAEERGYEQGRDATLTSLREWKATELAAAREPLERRIAELESAFRPTIHKGTQVAGCGGCVEERPQVGFWVPSLCGLHANKLRQQHDEQRARADKAEADLSALRIDVARREALLAQCRPVIQRALDLLTIHSWAPREEMDAYADLLGRLREQAAALGGAE